MTPTWAYLPRARFSALARPWLDEHAVDANVVVTVLAALEAGEVGYEAERWAVAVERGSVVGVVMHTAPYPPWLPGVGTDAARALADAWCTEGVRLRALNGDTTATTAFAARWRELTGARPRVVLSEGVHVLDALVPPEGVLGRLRPAAAADTDLVVRWLNAFAEEALPGRPPGLDERGVRRRLDAGRLLLWEHAGRPVSLAQWHPWPGGIGRLGPVYTPPEHRGHGYAAAVTAAATQAVLDAGGRGVMLFTDRANPTSRGVYARLGYREVGGVVEWEFDGPQPDGGPP